jgi:hypothetical protein
MNVFRWILSALKSPIIGGPRMKSSARKQALSRDNLDENGGGDRSLKRRPVAKL